MLLPQHVEQFSFFLGTGISQAEADEKAIELGFRQREGSFVIDGVLRGDDEKRRLEPISGAVDW